MRPADGATLCNSVAISVTAADNYRLAKAVYEYRKVGNSDWILIDETAAPTASNNTTFRYTWDISDINTGEYELRVSVYDDSINDIDENDSVYTANPAAIKVCTVKITKYTPPVAPVLSAVNGYKTVKLNWTYSGESDLLSNFEIYRADQENGYYQMVKTVSASVRSCTLTVPLNTTYYYKIVARDRYDAVETSNIVSGTSAGTDSEAPVAVISPETLLAATGVPFTFSAVNSTDNDAIVSYKWEFGDGNFSTDAMTSHTYAQDGTYTVRLTVTDDAGNTNSVSANVTVIDIAAKDCEYTLVTFNVVDAAQENTPALEGATLQFSSDIEGANDTTAVTDSNGQAKVLLLRGQHTVSVSREGYMPRSANILVTYQESGIQSVTLGISSTSLVSGELTATEMTYDEIVAAGIDVNDPDNNQVWKFATVLEFTVGLETFEIPVVAGYRNSAGTFFNGGGGWFSFGSGSGGSGGSGGRIGIFPMITEGFYLVIYGEAHWLKEMYNVELLVINNSNTDTIQNCTGTLVLPQGLSFAAMLHTSQAETINLGEIAKGGSGTATWYIRGDEAGDYYLTANVDGEFQSGDGVCTPFATSFSTKEPVRVYAGNALHMTITAQDYAVRGEDYEVTFKLENVSDKSLYNLSFGITGIEQYKVLGVSYDGCYVESEPMLLDKEDFGDSMIKTVPELAPGGYIEIKVSTTVWFNSAAEVAEIGVDLLLESKAGLGGAILGELINVVYYLTSVNVVTLEGSTTSVPYSVNIEQKERDNILDVFIKTISKELFLKDLQQGSIGGMMISVVGKSVEMDGTMISGAKSLLELQQGETDYTFEISINDGTGSSTCIENDYIKITSGTEGEGIFDFLNGTGWKINGTEIAFEAKMPGTSEIKLSVKNKYGELEREYTLNVTVEDTVLENKITAEIDGEVEGSFRVNENTLDISLQEQYKEEYAQFEKNPFVLNPSELTFTLEASGSDYNFALTADDLNTIMEESGTTVVTVDGADVDVSIGIDALDSVMGDGAELVIGTKLLSAEENAALGLKGTTYELTANVDTVRVSDFGSIGDEVTVYIDYELPSDVAPEDLVIFCIKDDGSTEMIDCSYDAQNKVLSFQTGHFSYYNIQTTNLSAVKDEAKSILDTYKNAADYRDAQKTELANAIAVGKAAIDAANDADAVAAALAAAKATMDDIKTDAQLDAEEESYVPPTVPSVPSISTETVKNEDGSVTTTVTDKSAGIVTETTEFPDGSQVVTKTDRNGTVTVTETDKYGNETTTTTNKTGETTVTEKRTDGVVVRTVTDSNGRVTATVSLPQAGKTEQVFIPADFGQANGNVTVKVSYHDGEEKTVVGYYSAGFICVAVERSATLVVLDDFTSVKISFSDILKGSYYYDAVLWAVQNGVTNGTSDTTFSPNVVCTRAQVVTFLWRAAGSPEPVTTVCPFSDVDMDSYYGKAVLWAVENGITNGTGGDTFSPNAECTRAQIVTFLWRSEGKPVAYGSNPFVDVADGAYYEDAVMWAVSNEITNGTGGNNFSPDVDCTRAQVVTFLYRCMGK